MIVRASFPVYCQQLRRRRGLQWPPAKSRQTGLVIVRASFPVYCQQLRRRRSLVIVRASFPVYCQQLRRQRSLVIVRASFPVYCQQLLFRVKEIRLARVSQTLQLVITHAMGIRHAALAMILPFDRRPVLEDRRALLSPIT